MGPPQRKAVTGLGISPGQKNTVKEAESRMSARPMVRQRSGVVAGASPGSMHQALEPVFTPDPMGVK